MPTPNWPDQLVDDLAKHKAVIVIGAGVSKQAKNAHGQRPPLWKEFLRAGLERAGTQGTRHIATAINNGDLLHACEWLKTKLDDSWNALLREQFVAPGYLASEIHELIFRLDARVVVTPNFDDIYERKANEITGGQVIVKNYYDEDIQNFLRDDGQYVIKMHGSMTTPDKIVFSRRDYARARINYPTFYDAFDACLLSNTFLFVGCGYEDPDIALVLENQNFTFPTSRPHYFVTPRGLSADMEQSLRQNRNLKCIKYDPANNHIALVESVKALFDLVEERRILVE